MNAIKRIIIFIFTIILIISCNAKDYREKIIDKIVKEPNILKDICLDTIVYYKFFKENICTNPKVISIYIDSFKKLNGYYKILRKNRIPAIGGKEVFYEITISDASNKYKIKFAYKKENDLWILYSIIFPENFRYYK